MIAKKVTDLIGNTALIELPLKNKNARFLLKIEKNNPGGSMKDRMAHNMVKIAIQEGKLKKGGTIVESSSGNTGIGLAITAAELGLNFIAVVDHHASPEKLSVMKAIGAKLIFIDGAYNEDEVGVIERQRRAKEIAHNTPGALFMNQSDNPANPMAYKQLAHEIFEQTNKNIQGFFGCMGTGGSMSGIAAQLKKLSPNILTVGVEPKGSILFGKKGAPYFQSGTGTPKGDQIGKVIDYTVIDQGMQVGDSEAFESARFLAKQFGLLVGGSTGGAIFKALEYIHHNNLKGTYVSCIVDSGEKYLNTVFNDQWMKQKNLLDKRIEHCLGLWLNIKKQYAEDSLYNESIA